MTDGELELDGLGTELQPAMMRCVPDLFPGVLIAKENDGRWKVRFELGQDVDLRGGCVVRGKGGIAPQIRDHLGIDVQWVRWTLRLGLRVTRALMWPPALPPPVMIRAGSTTSGEAFCLNQRIALLASVTQTSLWEWLGGRPLMVGFAVI